MKSENVHDGEYRGFLNFYTEEHPLMGGLDDNEVVVEFTNTDEDTVTTYWFTKEDVWNALSGVLQN